MTCVNSCISLLGFLERNLVCEVKLSDTPSSTLPSQRPLLSYHPNDISSLARIVIRRSQKNHSKSRVAGRTSTVGSKRSRLLREPRPSSEAGRPTRQPHSCAHTYCC
ncbi:hypothetical protein L596_006440 [Steinernema carpocapsae]|uniref:Uncharacterized protein n=1 Tax=Steinernema carpocapsae TaxID=34508 RepID=A0A4U8V8X3_STECR|nr:hypothetical protein L596_006440 [Steinernema carpocapsae]